MSLSRLVDALRDPARYSHPVTAVEVIETHISVVLLAGAFAYKFKKPVDFGFLDFRRLDDRRRFCQEELRLNRRTAPDLYLAVIPVTGSPEAPILDGPGEPIEFAVKMRRFPDEALLDRMARRGELGAAHIDAVASMVAAFHERIERAPADAPYGSPIGVLAAADENFASLLPSAGDDLARERLETLRSWTHGAFDGVADTMARRLREGFVRECHGDLHLGNVAWIDGAPVAFDGIEFNAGLRWIDVMNEVAFLVMDLAAHGLDALAWRCLDGYLEATGDFDGLVVLRFYLVYRALVRAKVAALRSRQADIDPPVRAVQVRAFESHLGLAERLSRSAPPAIVIAHGLSGSGKSTMAAALVAASGAVRVRSDVERKRLYGIGRSGDGQTVPPSVLYSPEATERTYEHLLGVARAVVSAGWSVIVDAAFLKQGERSRFRDLAQSLGADFRILACTAPEAVLRERVRARALAGRDPSDADEAVLARQLHWAEPLDYEETEMATVVDSADDPVSLDARIAALARRLGPWAGGR